MNIKRTLEKVEIRFQPRDWKCQRAQQVIADIKADLPRRCWNYDADSHVWTITLSPVTEPVIEEIIKRHTFDPNQLNLFDQPNLFQQAA